VDKPLILVDPLPRTLDLICDADTRRRLEALGELVICEDGRMPDDVVERHLPEAALIIGQTAMPRERLERAPKLRAIFNVETNFLGNIDYAFCQARGVPVLTPSSAFAEARRHMGLRAMRAASCSPARRLGSLALAISGRNFAI